jgi:hypothetical protein
MSRRYVAILAAVALSLAALSGPMAASEPNAGLDTTVSSENTEPIFDELGATPIAPDPKVIDPRPQAWDHVIISPDGTMLWVHFWGGVLECNGLHSVEVSPTASGIDLQLFMGLQPDAAYKACIELAVLYVTEVTFDAPLITQAMG